MSDDRKNSAIIKSFALNDKYFMITLRNYTT